MKEDLNYVETVMAIISVIDGEVKILLCRNYENAYYGHWALPNRIIAWNEPLEESITRCLQDQAGLPQVSFIENGVFGAFDRKISDRVIGIAYLGLVDSITVKLKQQRFPKEEADWFSIKRLPKLAFDHDEIIKEALVKLKKMIYDKEVLRKWFPSDFSLPELQRACECILDVKLDRRNFRKRLLQADIIEETGEKTEGMAGRPAKLYRFKDDTKYTTIY